MSEIQFTKDCAVCGKEFVVKTYNRGHAKYCGKECQRSACRAKGSGKASSTCLNCGRVFEFWASQTKGTYCSRQCKKEHWQKHPSADRGFDDLTGRTFGRWTVQSYADMRKGHHQWNVVCSCGTVTTTNSECLKNGTSQSCGCIQREGEPRPDVKTCTKCKQEFPYTDEFFHPNKAPKGGFRWGLTPWCHPCFKKLARKRHLRFRMKLKREVLSHYSGGGEPKCCCCGMADSIHFLTLDHINNDGKEDRKIHGLGMVFYARMKKLGYPTHLQTLCFNCNLGKKLNGGVCPHKSKKR